LISGRLVDSRTGQSISGATIRYQSQATDEAGISRSDAAGYYNLPLLSPGVYSLRAEATGYQAQELQELALAVAARLDIDFKLRPISDVWESGQYRSVFLPGSEMVVTFFGPDVDTSHSGNFDGQRGKRGTLESSVSAVIDSRQIEELPLAGRDVYTMLLALPGVTADTGTSRGLGVSVAGQRPTASNYLLDGLENNNYLITGPLTVEAPEAVQEYRISTNNYSAEYGRTSGFVANAVSRGGTNRFHGIGYWYLKNDALNANGFQQNLAGIPRLGHKEHEFGFQVGGPIVHDRLFFSQSLDHLRSRSTQEPVDFRFPSTAFSGVTTPTSIATKLLNQFPAPRVTDGANVTATLTLAPPVAVDRTLSTTRIDSAPTSRDRFTGRLSFARLGEPDFIWTPYRDFITPLSHDTTSVAATWQRSVSPSITNEAKLGFSNDDLHWNRAHPEIPTLISGDGTTLPGSPAFYSYKNYGNHWEVLDNVVRANGRHVTTAGVGLLFRNTGGYLTAGRDGQLLFTNAGTFGLDRPAFYSVADFRAGASSDFNREYRYRQFFLFLQDSFRVTARLTLNYGIRYENYGAPETTGAAQDTIVQLGSGSGFSQRLASATLVQGKQLFGSDAGDWAPRFGFAYDVTGRGKTILRGGYGIFYDRPFDNLWQNIRNNSYTLPIVTLNTRIDYLSPIAVPQQASNFPNLTLIDPRLRNGYAQSFFAGVQHQVTENLAIEVDTLGSLGRRLLTTDIVNRDFSIAANPGRFNPTLPDIAWRSGQGLSNYNALAASVRYRAGRAQIQASYTWSHSIDNQSDPLVGDFFDLNFVRVGGTATANTVSAFSQQFNSRADRGSSDFDQRHNLVLVSIFDVPGGGGPKWARAITRDWRVSELAAFRSGFPYTVTAPSLAVVGSGEILNQRADLFSTNATLDQALPGGKLLLNPANFSIPGPGQLGNTGRNAFTGPGLYNLDVSIARSFPLKYLGESGRLTVRTDIFNLLNHANLGNPDALFGSPTFGVAAYGRTERSSGFPAVAPLNETARQFQLILRLSF